MRYSNAEIYEKLISEVQRYFIGKNVQHIFMHGGCYWLAVTLHKYIPNSEIVFNRKIQHCACAFDHGIYDIRGRISGTGFIVADAKDMEYMQKHFTPCFDVEKVTDYLSIMMQE